MEKTIDILLNVYFILLGTLGFYFLWREWRLRAEEEKRRIREITDEYMNTRRREKDE